MNYSKMSENEQRLHIAAYGFEKVVTPDCYDIRAAVQVSDIAHDACRFADRAKSTLRFAVFIKAARMANLKPKHILAWLARSWAGKHAIAEFAKSELGMMKLG